MIKASNEATKGTGLNFLTTPYLGPAKVKSMEVETVGSVEDSIKIVFELKGEDVNGTKVEGLEHSHAIWAPDESNDEDVQKKADMASYIASRLVPKEKEEEVLAISGNNWIDYARNIVKFVKENGGLQREDVQIKVPGSTHNGNYKVKFPGYKNFITNGERAPLTWSNSELQENADYLTGKNSSPDTVEPSGDLADIEDASF